MNGWTKIFAGGTKMLCELNKEDLLRLLESCSPSYSEAKEYIDAGLGTMWGGWNEEWQWNNIDKLNNKELWALYKKLRR